MYTQIGSRMHHVQKLYSVAHSTTVIQVLPSAEMTRVCLSQLIVVGNVVSQGMDCNYQSVIAFNPPTNAYNITRPQMVVIVSMQTLSSSAQFHEPSSHITQRGPCIIDSHPSQVSNCHFCKPPL